VAQDDGLLSSSSTCSAGHVEAMMQIVRIRIFRITGWAGLKKFPSLVCGSQTGRDEIHNSLFNCLFTLLPAFFIDIRIINPDEREPIIDKTPSLYFHFLHMKGQPQNALNSDAYIIYLAQVKLYLCYVYE